MHSNHRVFMLARRGMSAWDVRPRALKAFGELD